MAHNISKEEYEARCHEIASLETVLARMRSSLDDVTVTRNSSGGGGFGGPNHRAQSRFSGGALFGNETRMHQASGSGGLFGNSNQAYQASGGFGFGNSKSYEPPSGGFGSGRYEPYQASSGFGNSNSHQPPSGGFGSAPRSYQASVGNDFGESKSYQPPSGGFGSAPRSYQAARGGGLFGNSNQSQQAPSGLFGNSSAQSGSGLFGNDNNSGHGFGGEGLFGQARSSAGRLFGNSNGSPRPASSAGHLFGNGSKATATGGDFGGGLFGNSNQAHQESGDERLFGGPFRPSHGHATGGLYGNSNSGRTFGSGNGAGGGGLFGEASRHSQGTRGDPLFGFRPTTSTGTSLFGNNSHSYPSSPPSSSRERGEPDVDEYHALLKRYGLNESDVGTFRENYPAGEIHHAELRKKLWLSHLTSEEVDRWNSFAHGQWSADDARKYDEFGRERPRTMEDFRKRLSREQEVFERYDREALKSWSIKSLFGNRPDGLTFYYGGQESGARSKNNGYPLSPPFGSKGTGSGSSGADVKREKKFQGLEASMWATDEPLPRSRPEGGAPRPDSYWDQDDSDRPEGSFGRNQRDRSSGRSRAERSQRSEDKRPINFAQYESDTDTDDTAYRTKKTAQPERQEKQNDQAKERQENAREEPQAKEEQNVLSLEDRVKRVANTKFGSIHGENTGGKDNGEGKGHGKLEEN
ncbi:Nucleoporin NUP49 [Fulvia fulva]|uniref:Nucleoporin NUP49 n=1 Tax=Passalora fulva TaxID=5499 RepID=A0A9Q8PHL7_PASFU|nr:Nucleoporin NUP49 [Fulvia fulva]KAK4626304.1 Nucleoporin NUP49 [Fulvia fulva]KAK4628474.1 Nucleoporin NUP49 [Fulvia fulva]UJO22799.1 Nucleoporin NUP49 [Fulvia fulva]WPV13840.1 Nucleoporin NUP49 [Fulvia fulva]WPV28197.1 Nucleoporin NUP49 [Fulvia fulva]